MRGLKSDDGFKKFVKCSVFIVVDIVDCLMNDLVSSVQEL